MHRALRKSGLAAARATLLVLLTLASPLEAQRWCPRSLRAIPERLIGNALADAEVAFSSVGPVVPLGRAVYIVDTRESRIVHVDTLGRYVRTFGRTGQGPGEFLRAGQLRASDFELILLDVEQQRIVVYDTAGAVLDTRSLPEVGPRPVIRWYPLRFGQSLAVLAAGGPSFSPHAKVVLLRPMEQGIAMDSVGAFHAGVVLVRGIPRTQIGLPGFGPSGDVAVDGDSVVFLVDGLSGRIDRHIATEQGLRRTASRDLPLPPPRLTRRDREEAKKLFESLYPQFRGARIEIDLPSSWPLVTRAFVDDEGRLWLRRGRVSLESATRSRDARWVVYSRDLRDCWDLEEPLDLRAVGDGRLYSVRRDEFDVPYVQVWRLTPFADPRSRPPTPPPSPACG